MIKSAIVSKQPQNRVYNYVQLGDKVNTEKLLYFPSTYQQEQYKNIKNYDI